MGIQLSFPYYCEIGDRSNVGISWKKDQKICFGVDEAMDFQIAGIKIVLHHEHSK